MLKRIIQIIAVFAGCLFLPGQTTQRADKLEPVSREEMIERARQVAEHRWVCQEINTRVTCPQNQPYKSDFKPGETVVGVAYDWGGMDHPEQFDRKLAAGQAAGSYSRHGVTECTTGIDCSGFVSWCWGLKGKRGTSNMREVAGRPKYNWFTDMKPGDALNKPGSHIVLFAGYREDGNPNVYEALGSAHRVILNTRRTWASLQGYYPLQYLKVIED